MRKSFHTMPVGKTDGQPQPKSVSSVDEIDEQTQPKVRYSDEKLEMFKSNIISSLLKAEEELVEMKKNRESLCESHEPGDIADDGNFSNDKTVIETEISRQIALIEQHHKSLILIEQKRYGICRITGNLIPEDRLIVAPLATLSVEAKNKMR
ncbi:MAG: TraR/DksA family transcriptional regulator [Candidatus Moranbacteria bacterium]|nr:TraR/DksA family transcriptional regulator [Candidatus Moranbacteria bacterium]